MDPVKLVTPSNQGLELRFDQALGKAQEVKDSLFKLGLLGPLVADRIEKVDTAVKCLRQLRWEHKFYAHDKYGYEFKVENDLSMHECFLDAQEAEVKKDLMKAESMSDDTEEEDEGELEELIGGSPCVVS